MNRGTIMAGIVTDEAELNVKRGFVGGFELETISLGLPFAAAFLKPGGRLGLVLPAELLHTDPY